MMSKSSFWANFRENLKRRGWTALLCVLTMFLALPVRGAMQISANQQKLRTNRVFLDASRTPADWLKERFLYETVCDTTLLVVFLVLAILLAVQGFSWLDNRRKLDMYLSVPIPSRRRYAVIYGNGVGIFALSYLACLLITLLVGFLMGVGSGKVLLYALLVYVCNLVYFLAVYNLTLIAVMMTGNVLVSLLGTGVFLFYEFMVRSLADGMRLDFFRTYCYLEDIKAFNWTSPLIVWLGGRDSLYGLIEGYRYYFPSFLQTVVLILIQAIVYGILAYLLYRRRKAEAAGSAMAFRFARTPVKLLLMIPITLWVGRWFRQLSDGNDFFAVVGMLVGLLLSHGLIQMIYAFDVRSVLKNKWHILGAGAVCAVIFSCFYFDLTGYDAYIPQAEEIEGVAVAFQNEIYGLGYYEELFQKEMRYEYDSVPGMLGRMRSEDETVIGAVRELARQDRTAKVDRDSYHEGYTPLFIKYTLKNGRDVYRVIMLNVESSAEWMDPIFLDDSFRRARYQIYDAAFLEGEEKMAASYSNGVEEVGYIGELSELVEALRKDLEGFSYSMMLEQLPVGRIQLRYPVPGNDSENYYSWNYPIYEGFTESISLMKEWDAYIEPREDGSFLEPEQVMSISLTCYNLQEEDKEYSYDGSYALSYSEDRAVTEMFTSVSDIEDVLPALYPEMLLNLAGGDLMGRLGSDNYGVMITMKPETDTAVQEVSFVVLGGKLPRSILNKMTYSEE